MRTTRTTDPVYYGGNSDLVILWVLIAFLVLASPVAVTAAAEPSEQATQAAAQGPLWPVFLGMVTVFWIGGGLVVWWMWNWDRPERVD